ncbi:heme ABC transporter ATP-binding protein [Rhizobium sp. EC-SD404]|uniref:heme ABC transporter ATP-binding protein n=1 Tax=Rhizobium sp. EC-SD404 TaxID=2038389 RepID=UPI001253261E|nr:heme ABC transporter ATP-binding protein [Rhizobium sp. EC-SD404]VVS98924.1 Hemin import ATP-binding protein HmuV [Rhizobium sp. EC-SD404]
MSFIAKGVSAVLGSRRVLQDVDFEAKPGDVTAIVGPNGSGKTTCLKALSGELRVDGHISVDGTDIRSLKPWQLAERRAVLQQATTMAFPFRVYEVVQLGLSRAIAGDSSDGAHRRIDQALTMVGLNGFGDRLYQELSGGEQQRVHLARVLCQVWEPVKNGSACYLFLDEPVASLDIRHQISIMQVARDYARRGGGVIAVMHDLNLTAMFADRVALFRAGRVAAFGPPADVFTDTMVHHVFDVPLAVSRLPTDDVPFVLPQSCGAFTPRRQ